MGIAGILKMPEKHDFFLWAQKHRRSFLLWKQYNSTFHRPESILIRRALVAELVYALVSGASRATGVGSTPIQCTISIRARSSAG